MHLFVINPLVTLLRSSDFATPSSGNMNINGIRNESAEESMIFIFDKIDNQYFSASNVDEHDEDYILDELNININVPTEVQGEATLTGNININNALKALEDVNLYGEVKNTNDSVIFSKYGDIFIDSQNVNLNGLVYAPFGSVTINAQNLNLNNVVIIAESIVLTCPSVNANNSSNASSFVGTTSEPLDIPYDEWQYMKDENENDFPDFFEDYDNWVILKDTDGDHLPDCVEQFLGTDATLVDTDGDMLDDYYEVFITGTDPTKPDTDDNGVADGEEDFDSDGLTNYQEYVQGTSPWNRDSDSDNLSDGDEVNTYGTNPLEPDTDFDGLSDADEVALGTNPNLADTDGNGTPDGEEKFDQTYVYDVENKDCAVEQVIVSMKGTGNLQKNTSVESVMNKDIICSDVVGLIGEPFEIKSESQFDTATITFKIDQTKLGNTGLDNLLFLWYDEENYEFVEMETTHDAINSTVSITTTHFSRYMVVDKSKWYEAWAVKFNYNPASTSSHAPTFRYNTVLAIDCSGSMNGYDPITNNSVSSEFDGKYYARSCQRIKAAQEFINNMNKDDRAAIVLFDSNANIITPMTNDLYSLRLGLQSVYSSGGTNFYAALQKSYEVFEGNMDESYVYNRIILLSDGEDGDSYNTNRLLQTIYGEDSKDKRKSVKIYTIGLGNSYDSNLKGIADKTGGDFYKAYTADDLLDIYTNMGFEDDFDKTDTDGDGLYDAVEAAGIRIQNGTIISGCDPTSKDTDNDGLEDGQEIDPTIRYKNGIWTSPELEQYTRQYYFVMYSNPVDKVDTDNDGYDDSYDLNPNIYDDYTFLDNEIYTIGMFYDDSYYSNPIETVSDSSIKISDNFEYSDEQYFRFKWCGTGYKICALKYENNQKVLTVNQYGNVVLETDQNLTSQIWEVLPHGVDDYGNFEDGLLIKSKIIYTNDAKPTSLFLTHNGTGLCTTNNKSQTKVKIYSPAYWTRFGELYLNYLGWEDTQVSPYNYTNYPNNVSEGLDSSNIENYKGYNMIINQSGGKFPDLMFGGVSMDGVCCEVMGTYNALTLVGADVDFFKLSIEFEMNAIKSIASLTKPGTWGSDPYKIDNCLDAYNVSYTTIDRDDYDTNKEACGAFDSELKTGKSAIISYHFPSLKFIYAGIHTYAAVYDNNDTTSTILTFNRYSNHETSKRYSSTYSALNNGEDHYMIGYILQ